MNMVGHSHIIIIMNTGDSQRRKGLKLGGLYRSSTSHETGRRFHMARVCDFDIFLCV
jgi:hypothetical protein